VTVRDNRVEPVRATRHPFTRSPRGTSLAVS